MLREKKRYIAFRYQGDIKELDDELLKIFGELYFSELRFKLIENYNDKKIAIIRVSNKYAKKIIGALSLLNKIRCIPFATSGSLKAIKKRISSDKVLS